MRIAALVAGVMDVAGASPRRFFFEVLRAFTHDRAQAERLAHFASPAGREDLSTYNEREGAHSPCHLQHICRACNHPCFLLVLPAMFRMSMCTGKAFLCAGPLLTISCRSGVTPSQARLAVSCPDGCTVAGRQR